MANGVTSVDPSFFSAFPFILEWKMLTKWFVSVFNVYTNISLLLAEILLSFKNVECLAYSVAHSEDEAELFSGLYMGAGRWWRCGGSDATAIKHFARHCCSISSGHFIAR